MALSKKAFATSAGRRATSSSKVWTAKATRLPTCAGKGHARRLRLQSLSVCEGEH
jgi:hypothetical protein